MLPSLLTSQAFLLAGCITVILLLTMLSHIILRWFIFGREWPSSRVKIPWRFSLLSIFVLTVIAAVAFALLRDVPAAAILVVLVSLPIWLAFARFMEFRQLVAERRNKEFEAAMSEEKSQGAKRNDEVSG